MKYPNIYIWVKKLIYLNYEDNDIKISGTLI